MVLPSVTSTAPSLYFTYPPSSLLKLPPSSYPQALTPPVSDHSLARPFNINPELYNNALHLAVPISIALTYATTVFYVNGINKKRDHKPWAFSRSNAFFVLRVIHNVLLALYSGWTFVGMYYAFRNSCPGWNSEQGLAGAADALCKINGPRGWGSATTYNESLNGWSVTDRAIKLAEGSPDTTDVGRIWNEGLAFYGWLFYLSKFYEVLDTAIILVQGKSSPFLQTYHHAGAMLCMWAGIRYMSPPIWLFVFLNSGVHTLMYTYYTMTTLTIQVPRSMKRILTFLQISQIFFGTSYALLHLFIAYDIPVETPYLYVHNLSNALPSTASSISSAVSSAFASATVSAGAANWLKKVALRAAGEEGLAENVRNEQGNTFGVDAVNAAQVERAQQEIRYRLGTQKIHCIDTSGEVFAILFNAIYLIPLFGLFVVFFRRSYIGRARAESAKPDKTFIIKESSKDAFQDVERKIVESMENEQGDATAPRSELEIKLEKAKNNAKKDASDMSNNLQSSAKDIANQTQRGAIDIGNKAKDAAGDLPAKAQDLGNQAKEATGDLPAKLQDLGQKAQDAVGDLPAKIQNGAHDGAEKAKKVGSNIPVKAQEMGHQAKKAAKDVQQNVQDDLEALKKKMTNGAPKPQESETPKTNGETKNRERSPDKASKPREKSPVKAPTPREKSPEKKIPVTREKSPVKAPAPREKSPVKLPVPIEEAPEKPPQTAEEPTTEVAEKPMETAEEVKKEPEEEKSSPGLDASAYEIVPDEPKTEEEKKAEAEMQPKLE